MVTLSSVQPEGDFLLFATLTDEDGLHELNPPGLLAATTWQWARSMDGVSGWTDIAEATASEYKPVLDDVDHFLRATANYWDSESFENPQWYMPVTWLPASRKPAQHRWKRFQWTGSPTNRRSSVS